MLREKILAAKEQKEIKKNDVKSFVWKEAKKEINGIKVQNEIRLMDASEEQLQQFYNHCFSMLYSSDKVNPGRYVLLNILKTQREKCNTELYLRYLEYPTVPERTKYPRINYLQDLRTMLDIPENKQNCPKEIWNTLPIKYFTAGIPAEFENLSLSIVLDGCLDCLGRFDKSHITLTFLLKLGVWFKPTEMQKLLKKDSNGKYVDCLVTARKELGLKEGIDLKSSPKGGLSYSELEAMIKLKSKKYSELTTEQLTTLRNKVLFRLEDDVRFHIEQWEERIRQILKVCEVRNLTIKTCERPF